MTLISLIGISLGAAGFFKDCASTLFNNNTDPIYSLFGGSIGLLVLTLIGCYFARKDPPSGNEERDRLLGGDSSESETLTSPKPNLYYPGVDGLYTYGHDNVW